MVPHVDEDTLTPINIILLVNLLDANLHPVSREHDVLLLHLVPCLVRDILHDAVDDESHDGEDGEDHEEDDEREDAAGHFD